jgi:RHS repeat-associated protein
MWSRSSLRLLHGGNGLLVRDEVTRNTVSPRGIDMIEAERVNSAIPNDPLLNNPSRVFPVYDGHGNMVASLKRGSGSYTLANEKRYDAWGQVRYDDGVGTSDHVINPRNRYCANVGHWDDDVLGLTYMRARWYEPTTGRFVSEDPARDGLNWFTYAKSSPVTSIDFSGRTALAVYAAVLAATMIAFFGAEFVLLRRGYTNGDISQMMARGAAVLIQTAIMEALEMLTEAAIATAETSRAKWTVGGIMAMMMGMYGLVCLLMIEEMYSGDTNQVSAAPSGSYWADPRIM